MGLKHSSLVEMYVHLVWSTWDRLPLLAVSIREDVYRCLRAECASMGGDALAMGGIENHVHLLVRLPATVAVATFVKQMKGVSSHLVNHELKTPFKWQGGYAAFSVSRPLLPLVRDYILRQEEHHREGTLVPHVEPR